MVVVVVVGSHGGRRARRDGAPQTGFQGAARQHKTTMVEEAGSQKTAKVEEILDVTREGAEDERG